METICPHCQLGIPKGKFICPVCGIDIRDWNPDKLRCPICLSLYPQGTKFCLKDGSPLERAIVDFDTEATIFLPGAVKPPKSKDDPIIPKLKFSDDQNRAFPKLERDDTGHFKPPPPPPKKTIKETPSPSTFSYNPPAEPELEMPEITIDPTPPTQEQIIPSKTPVQESPMSPPDILMEPPLEYKVPSKGRHLKVKPLEEYEKLLQEERERIATQKKAQSPPLKFQMYTSKQQRPGFFKRFVTALKVLFGR